MEIPVRPIVLLADSQLLFWNGDDGEPFLRRVRAMLPKERPRAVYIGASNGDEPAFYDIFKSAMESIGVFETRHFPAEPSGADWDFFDESHLVLLAGGDVAQGWRTFKKNGLKQKIIERYYAGAVLMGVSAGAVQLGLRGYREDDDGETRLFECFKLVPALVDAHAEPDWERLATCLPKVDEPTHGLGIPTGGGAILHPDLTLEPVRRPVTEVRLDDDGESVQNLIFPPAPGEELDVEGPDDDVPRDETATAETAETAAKTPEILAAEPSTERSGSAGPRAGQVLEVRAVEASSDDDDTLPN